MVKRKKDRLRRLSGALYGRGALHLHEAAALLDVSPMTVRRDIATAPEHFTYLGGYIVAAGPEGYRLERERDNHASAKAIVCAHAARLIHDGDTIFVDCGTTTPHLVHRLPAEVKVTVVCYALNIAEPLADNPNVQLILLGGLYNASSASFAVDDGLRTLARLGVNKAFLSAGGVHPTRGVSCSNFHEVAVKQAAMSIALEKHLLVDASKFGQVKSAYFANVDQFDSIITSPPTPDVMAELADLGGRLVIAGAEP
ncbi:DeoR/GlpR family DNA-binding transcription regulator [Methylocapsa sp. S129]|uniref:DeoR/GlpR family DNA-binding transcription regulator n=1 Tax=Methylocapsa sp. S129 TaxID=1641869 RepID=UPI00131A9847|nr:DeoR/GlpR family DNA-binding transcription regulator [Methylocapsa sp. S129]